MSTLFDALGIDESAGIDADEVEALKRALDRIKVEAAQVAKVNDTTTTKELLNAMVIAVRKVGSVTSVDELHQVLGTLGSSTAMAVAPPASATTLSPNAQRVAELFDAADSGQQQAIIRVLNTGDPAQIRVDRNGTPVMVAQLQDAWDDDHDVNHNGSQAEQIHTLMQQLATANAAALPSGTGMVPQADLDTARTALTNLKAAVKTEVDKLGLGSATTPNFRGDGKAIISVSEADAKFIERELGRLTRP